jgi:hypothetical protein
MFISPRPVTPERPKRADKTSLLTASGMLLHAFLSTSIHFGNFRKTMFTIIAD